MSPQVPFLIIVVFSIWEWFNFFVLRIAQNVAISLEK